MDFLIDAAQALCWEGLWGHVCAMAQQEEGLPLISDVWLEEAMTLLVACLRFPYNGKYRFGNTFPTIRL